MRQFNAHQLAVVSAPTFMATIARVEHSADPSGVLTVANNRHPVTFSKSVDTSYI
jgi:hypothetical protein